MSVIKGTLHQNSRSSNTNTKAWYTAISRKVVGKNVHGKIRKVIWSMMNTLFLTTVAVKPTFVAFL